MFLDKLENIFNDKAKDFSSLLEIKDIVLYGAGSLGEMAVNILKEINVKPKYIIDKSKKGCIENINIITPNEIKENDKNNDLFLNCISTISRNEIENYLKELGCKNIMHFYNYAYIKCPKLLSNGWFLDKISKDEQKEIEKVCEALSHDELSLNHYIQFLWEKLRVKEVINKDFSVLSGRKYFLSPCIENQLTDNEILLDCGADLGQTINKFIEKTNNKFNKIYAFEPNSKAYKYLKDNFGNDERILLSDKVINDKNGLVNFKEDIGGGMASKIFEESDNVKESISIDSLNINPTIIKLHIEGNELNALLGAVKTIKKYRPLIMVFADHNKDGLYKIAKFLYSLPDYKLYFNLHDYVGNTAIFYAINNK